MIAVEHNVSLYFMHYNFCRVHQTIRVTPARKRGCRIMYGNLRNWWR
jgi:hypothetical protein